MAKKIAWAVQAKADLRAIDQPTALRILHGLARFLATEEATSNASKTPNLPSFGCASVLTAFDSAITATLLKSLPSSTVPRPTAEASRRRSFSICPHARY
jgi:hypothetical protein